MAKSNGLIIAAAVGVAGYFIIKNMGSGFGGSTNKRQALLTWINNSSGDSQASKLAFAQILNAMTEAEINATYDFVFNYVNKNRQVPQGTSLWYAVSAISEKYNIFT